MRQYLFNIFRRRSPKKSVNQKGTLEDDAEKLAQEAFRLFRTAQNLLTLKDPVLGESKRQPHRGSLIDLNRTSLDTAPLYAPIINRKLNTRESRISFQSSSDGSVHSNSSSSRIETDEENTIAPGIIHSTGRLSTVANDIDMRKDRIKSVASSSADDESGFSSMNSFHHENHLMLPALPVAQLNSTMISNQFYPDVHDDCDLIHGNLQDLSLKPLPLPPVLPARDSICPAELQNGLPINHRSYDSAPPLPPKRNLTTFNSILQTVNDDKSQKRGINVAWV